VWFEYTLDCAQLAKERGLYTAYVTNGYLTSSALDMIGPYLDAFRVDIKGFSDRCYRRLAKVSRWRDVLEVTKRARHNWGMHVEVVTNVIPGLNDDDQLQQIAEWIRDSLGADTPWHVTAFHPDALLTDVPQTSSATLILARQAGMAAGLHFVYTGNVRGTGGEHTYCPGCGRAVVERDGYQIRVIGVAKGGRCANCSTDLNMRGV
jgi:pyruvate formate lyase activating enzyme